MNEAQIYLQGERTAKESDVSSFSLNENNNTRLKSA